MTRKTIATILALALLTTAFTAALTAPATAQDGDDDGVSVIERIQVYVEAIFGGDDAQVETDVDVETDNDTNDSNQDTTDPQEETNTHNDTHTNVTDDQTNEDTNQTDGETNETGGQDNQEQDDQQDNQTQDDEEQQDQPDEIDDQDDDEADDNESSPTEETTALEGFEIVVRDNASAGTRTIIVTRDGEPVRNASVEVNGETEGRTDANGSVTTDQQEEEIGIVVRTQATVIAQHRTGGPDQDHNVSINESRAVEIAENATEVDANWSVDNVRLVSGAGFYDVRLSSDNATAKVRVDGSSGTPFFVMVKMPVEDDEQEDTPEASIEVTDYTVSSTSVGVNESLTVTATLTNTGDANASTNVTLWVDGNESTTREVTVQANSSAVESFTLQFESTGEHTVTVNDLPTTTVTVQQSQDTETTSSDTVRVQLAGAPDGLQKYSVSLDVDGNASVLDVEAGLIKGNKFEVVESSNSSVTFRAVDFTGHDAFNDTRTLASVSLTDEVTANQLNLTVNALTDRDGAEMDAGRVSVSLEGLFDAPLPGSSAGAAPTDPDGDGLYEDVNGDGTVGFGDAVALAFVDYDALDMEQSAALDFDGDGELGFSDAIELAFQA